MTRFAALLATLTLSCAPLAEGAPGDLPFGFPEPKVPRENPTTTSKVQLGRHLFYDPALAKNGTQSCATCHQQELAFTDGRVTAVGSTGEVHHRNTSTLTNVAYVPHLTWSSPLIGTLERQALLPLFGDAPVEMGWGDAEPLLDRLRSRALYRDLFASAFPGDAEPVSLRRVTEALAAFQRTLISGDSPYDRYLAGDVDALSDSARRGLRLFESERLECFHCHSGFNFSDSVDHAGVVSAQGDFHNTGLYDLDGAGAYPARDRGLYDVTLAAEDMGAFRAPTLRNVAVTAPYMHDGSVATLREVLEHYENGGRTTHGGPAAGDGSRNPFKSDFVAGFLLSDAEREDVLAFLHSLTDRTFLENPAFADPWSARSLEESLR